MIDFQRIRFFGIKNEATAASREPLSVFLEYRKGVAKGKYVDVHDDVTIADYEEGGRSEAANIHRIERRLYSDMCGDFYTERANSASNTEAAANIGVSADLLKKAVDFHMMENPGKPKPSRRTEADLAAVVGKDSPVENVTGTDIPKSRADYVEPEDMPLPKKGDVNRYLLTCAQNNTPVHKGFWENLLALKDHYEADLMISRFTYNKSQFGSESVKPGSQKASDKEPVKWADEISPYVHADNEREKRQIRLAPGIVWCVEMNILPTAVTPLSGLKTYTRNESSVFPHTKVCLESYAVMKLEDPRFGYTTGAATEKNYIMKKAGQKALFHHVHGALLVEVDWKGRWWARQICGDGIDGNICDLDVFVRKGVVKTGMKNVAAMTWGDIHVAQIDEDNSKACWKGKDSIAEVLQPEHQFFHDVLDFLSRNHHDAGNIHKMYEKHVKGVDCVEDEVGEAACWLEERTKEAGRWKGKSYVVASNHDDFYIKWLGIADAYAKDYLNAVFFLRSQLAYYESITKKANGKDDISSPFKWAYESYFKKKQDGIVFLKEDEQCVVAGVEHALHGHLGANGARGSLVNLSGLGVRVNLGHYHSAGIRDGAYVAGLSGKMDMSYNRGPSSWSHSHIVTYRNSKRAILTIRDGKWRA